MNDAPIRDASPRAPLAALAIAAIAEACGDAPPLGELGAAAISDETG